MPAARYMSIVELVVPSLQYVQVLQAPIEVASLPIRKIGHLPQVHGPRESTHRIKVQGNSDVHRK